MIGTQAAGIRLGSLPIEVRCADSGLRQLLETIWRTRLEAAPAHPELLLELTYDPSVDYGPSDELRWTDDELSSDLVVGRFDGFHLQLRIDPDPERLPQLDHYLLVVLHSALRRLGAIRLHAAACRWQERTLLFSGPKGSGKSTLALFLSRRGGLVLAEDQLLLRHSPWRLSGCDGRLRVTEENERYFFPEGLTEPATDYAGTLKKEIELGACCRPYEDFPLGELYFPRVGERLAVQPLPRKQVVARLCADLLPTHRFSHAAERLQFFDMLSDFAAAVQPFELELSPRLADLDALTDLLGGGR